MSTLLESGKTSALLGRFNNFSGKIGKSDAKITKNWKIFVVIEYLYLSTNLYEILQTGSSKYNVNDSNYILAE